MLNRNRTSILKVTGIGLVTLLSMGSAFSSEKLDSAIAIEKKTTEASSKSQKKIDRFAEDTFDMAQDYSQTLRIIEQLKVYNNQLETLIASQEEEMQSIQRDIDNIDETERGVAPLMDEMIVSLESFIKLDIPFRLEKRLKVVATLKSAMVRADVQTAEKYRLIMNAYDRELDYGNGYESYTGTIQLDGTDTQVDFLRFGRLLLVYLSLDGTRAGYYNPESKKFEPLDESYIRGISQGIKMANKQASPNLIKLPVPVAKGA